MDLEVVGTAPASGASTISRGAEVFTVPAGQTLTIETSPAGEDVLSVEVPAGKQWTVHVVVTVRESDA